MLIIKDINLAKESIVLLIIKFIRDIALLGVKRF